MSDLEVSKPSAKTHPLIRFLLVMTLCYLVSFGASETSLKGLSDYYPSLVLPGGSAPAWLFNPAWTVCYGLMGLAAWMGLNEPLPTDQAKKAQAISARAAAISFFIVQLVLNGLWALLFFSYRKLPVAGVEAIFCACATIMAAAMIFRISRSAGWVFLIPLAWSLYEAFFSMLVWRMNR
jgi:tryptophan-rich sensory protein